MSTTKPNGDGNDRATIEVPAEHLRDAVITATLDTARAMKIGGDMESVRSRYRRMSTYMLWAARAEQGEPVELDVGDDLRRLVLAEIGFLSEQVAHSIKDYTRFAEGEERPFHTRPRNSHGAFIDVYKTAGRLAQWVDVARQTGLHVEAPEGY